MRLVSDTEETQRSWIVRHLLTSPIEACGIVEAVAAAHNEALDDGESHFELLFTSLTRTASEFGQHVAL
jgi:hypothetical protein